MTLCLATPRAVAAGNTGARPFSHAKFLPTSELASFVEHYWVSRWDRRGQVPRQSASLLDPCVHLRIHEHRAEVMGVWRGTHRVRIADEGCVIGVKFKPAGFHAFVQRPVREWTDRIVPAETVFPDVTLFAERISSEVLACRGGAEEHGVIIGPRFDTLLGLKMPVRDAIADEVSALVSHIAASAEVKRMSDLVRTSGRSERTLDRLFARYVGASPSWVVKRYRLQAAARRLTSSSPCDVSTVACEMGYADQAHFIRDFRATIGVTPGVYAQLARQ